MLSIADIQQSLSKTSFNAKDWFLSAANTKGRNEYFAKGKLGDDGSGAVYVYFNESGNALYVGETSRPIKRRMHDLTSSHKTSDWWDAWRTVSFLQVHDRTDRLALELLLILALKPSYNLKPGPREFDCMFLNQAERKVGARDFARKPGAWAGLPKAAADWDSPATNAAVADALVGDKLL